MGVFAPAIYLFENNFDLLALLQEKNWWQGGPNVHSLSLVTWVAALAMKSAADAQSTFLALHSLTFLAMSYGLMIFVQLIQRLGFNRYVAVASGFFVLLFPVSLVQVGYMYTEIPVLVLSVMAVERWSRGQIDIAIGICVIALLVKFTAIALGIAMVLMLLITAIGQSRSARFANGMRVLILCGLIVLIRNLPGLLGRSEFLGGGWGNAELLFAQLNARMTAIPDLSWLMLAGIGCSVVVVIFQLANRFRGSQENIKPDPVSQAKLICLFITPVFCATIVLASFTQTLLLPRYLVPVIPFALISILLLIKQLGQQKLILFLLIPMHVFFIANTNGKFYPENLNSFSVIERSHAYQGFNAVKVDGINALVKKPDEIPAYVTKEINYMVSHPMMGYVDSVIPNVYPVFTPQYLQMPLAEYPDHFYLLKASEIHGGGKIQALVDQAQIDNAYDVHIEDYSRAGYTVKLFEIRRKNGG